MLTSYLQMFNIFLRCDKSVHTFWPTLHVTVLSICKQERPPSTWKRYYCW